MITPTNNPAFYFPPEKGVYEIKPGLMPVGKDLGNGKSDCRVFQFDNQFRTYYNNKLKARNESEEKYICIQPQADLCVINRFILETLCKEYPDYFSFNMQNNYLDCHLTDKQLQTNTDNLFVELGMQVPEDLAVMQLDSHGNGKVIALHLCAPNHWAAQDKIGEDFIGIHMPVPDMERIYQRQREINQACLNKGPFVRFAWGLSTDKYLNHHPQPAAGVSQQDWQGRNFNPDKPELYMRVERQTLTGFKAENQLLFTIRSYFYDVQLLEKQQKLALVNAINTMNDQVLRYKGLSGSKEQITCWLKSSL